LVEQGNQEAANEVLHGFLDCWSLGSMVDQARSDWFDSADKEALAVLVRAAEIIQMAIGWPAGPAGPWPVPDESWFSAKARQWAAPPERAISEVCEATADELVSNRAGLVSQVLRGEIVAIHVTGVPSDPVAYELALGELQMEAPRQAGFRRAGYAALHVDELPAYGAGWDKPIEGKPGKVLVSVADGVVVPALDAGAPMAMVGWIVWPDTHRPRRVHPVAVAALQAMDGNTPSEEIALKVDVPADRWAAIEDSLLALGAATAV